MTRSRLALVLVGSVALAGCPTSPVPVDAPSTDLDAAGVDAGDASIDLGDASIGASDASGDAGPLSATPIDAEAGGIATSTDGLFFLYVPPGALAADTEITIRILPLAERPAEAADAVSGVYEVLPEGLTFATPATAVTYYPSAPPDFETADGVLLFEHQSRSASGVVEAVPTTTRVPSPGAAASLATLEHLSTHWDDMHLRDLRMGVLMPEGPYNVRATPSAEAAIFGAPGAVFPFQVAHSVLTATGITNVVALVPPGGSPGSPGLNDFTVSRSHLLVERVMVQGATSVVSQAELPADGTFTVTPRPIWRCDGVDPGTAIWTELRVSALAFQAVSRVSCSDGSAILLADSQRVVASASGPAFSGGVGAAANVIVPNRAALDTFTVVGDTTITEGTTFTSELGPAAITLSSSLQTVTATHDGSRYALTGLLGAAALGASDTLTVSAGTTSVPVSAPAPITSVSDLLDPPTGLTSTVSWPDGACDAFVVQALLAGSALPGEAQIIRRVPCDGAPLSGGRRRIRILEDATLTALAARGLTISEITVGVVNEADCSALFPALGNVPCQAGRLLRFSPSALEPFVPGPCGDPVSVAGNVEIRWDSAAMTCDVVRTGDTATGIDVGRIDTRSGGSVWRYTPTSASHGTISGMRIDGLPQSTDVTVVLAEPSGITLTITLRIDGDTLSVSGFTAT